MPKKKKIIILISAIILLIAVVGLFLIYKDRFFGQADIAPVVLPDDFTNSNVELISDVTTGGDTIKQDMALTPKTQSFAGPQTKYLEVEELPDWGLVCYTFSDAHPTVPCGESNALLDPNVKISGKASLKLHNTREKEIRYSLSLPAKKNTYYKVSLNVKIANRKVFNFLNLNYPAKWSAQTDYRDNVDLNKGIWGGLYDFTVNDTAMLPAQAKDAPYRSASGIDWFQEDHTINTGDNDRLEMLLMLRGYEGDFYVDKLTIEETENNIDDAYLHIPITGAYQGMKIQSVSSNPLIITTNAAKFSFVGNQLITEKGGVITAALTFPAGFLNGLALSQEEGLVILGNNNLTFSLGADSTAITKLKADCQLTIESSLSGGGSGYHTFEAGIIFATDYNQGILFSEIRPKSAIQAYSGDYHPNYDFTYTDAKAEQLGLKNWQIINDFSAASWKIQYNFQKGSGFLAEVFPPKEFDLAEYCRDNFTMAADVNGGLFNLNRNPNQDFIAGLDATKLHANTVVVWMDRYATTENNLNPESFYYYGSDKKYYHKNADGSYAPTPPEGVTIGEYPTYIPVDVAGPFSVEQETALRRLTAQAHERKIKVVVYFSPSVYYTSNTDTMLNNLKTIMDSYGVDGVYFDALYQYEPLKILELFRKTRNMLGDKYLILHSSWTGSLIQRTDHFRVPVYDAYADQILGGEWSKHGDDNTFKLNYAGHNVSNTTSSLLPETRPVDYTLPYNMEYSLSLSLSPDEQIAKILSYQGKIFLTSVNVTTGVFRDKLFSYTIPFDLNNYWQKQNELCQNTNTPSPSGSATSSASPSSPPPTTTTTTTRTPAPKVSRSQKPVGGGGITSPEPIETSLPKAIIKGASEWWDGVTTVNENDAPVVKDSKVLAQKWGPYLLGFIILLIIIIIFVIYLIIKKRRHNYIDHRPPTI